MVISENDITQYNDVFDKKEFETILEYVARPCWQYGHGSHDETHPEYNNSVPFWAMNLDNEEYFTKYLLNKIQEKTNTKFDLTRVYANGHTFGTKGSFHQDWFDEKGRTFLLYANSTWNVNWGGSTIFNLGNEEYKFCIPKPNSAVLFPGMMYHCADATNRIFTGLRVTIAWKLLLR